MGTGEPAAHATISMTARENALYQLGVVLGTAHGLETAAQHVVQVAERLRGWPAAQQAAMFLEQAAGNVQALSVPVGRRGVRASIVKALKEFSTRLQTNQEDIAQWIEQAGRQMQNSAQQRRAEFVAALARLEPDSTEPIGPKKARPRAKTIGERVVRRVVEGLHDALKE